MRMLFRPSTIAWLVTMLSGQNLALAQSCPGLSMVECRATGENGGKLLNRLNSKGKPVWLSPCGMKVNTSPERLDKLCEQIATCPGSGAFGGFLSAVTEHCRRKQFDGYFGLDGITFGILDWTQDNLPSVLGAYQKRNRERFNEVFGKLGMPMKNGCIDARWVCNANRQGTLTCDQEFNAALRKGLQDPDFKKAELDVALRTYRTRLKKYAPLGLKSEYGNVAMFTVGNNLRPVSQCEPTAWKAACIGKDRGEPAVVDCMLKIYADNGCRGTGTREEANARVKAIQERYKDRRDVPLASISTDAIYECASK
ncbi:MULTISPECIES: hypothetical protein [unclassified Caballeronia]|uniref:hypothetical protein n=1 Tax=unclassified Caballeronia TaxID=2646786 RepID=UPI002858F7EF|nr:MULTISPECIES: hypothetical protein [unclassified Caballeronia]MDR5754894.1 hypothetical protein [Caballeronia sp. LZ024]MDR5845453.1 hypothetical protein [Caballeronia sp. LZ031]